MVITATEPLAACAQHWDLVGHFPGPAACCSFEPWETLLKITVLALWLRMLQLIYLSLFFKCWFHWHPLKKYGEGRERNHSIRDENNGPVRLLLLNQAGGRWTANIYLKARMCKVSESLLQIAAGLMWGKQGYEGKQPQKDDGACSGLCTRGRNSVQLSWTTKPLYISLIHPALFLTPLQNITLSLSCSEKWPN